LLRSECQGLGAGLVKPLEVVYRTEDRLGIGDVADEAQKGEPDQEPVRRYRLGQPEHGLQGGTLRAWQAAQRGTSGWHSW